MTSRRLLDRPDRLPWTIPVPVKTSTFSSLHKRHAQMNIEVDLGAIRAFGIAERRVPVSSVLWADFQDSREYGFRRRLGGGRSGTYRSHYLKGVGRTTLAANWADVSQIDYHTGHHLPSGAIREYLVSEYAKAKGCGDSVVAVEGVLLRRRSKYLAHHFTSRLARARPAAVRQFAADLSLQAITVKRAGFARYSNVLWALNRLDVDQPDSIDRLLGLLQILAEATAGPPLRNPRWPAEIGEQLANAVDRGWDRFHRTWRAGVYWNAVHNNFAIDGRFIDLELPSVIGQPLVGLFMGGSHRACLAPTRMSQTGIFEVLSYVVDTRASIRRMLGLLLMFVDLAPARDPIRRVLALARRSIAQAFPSDHWIWSSTGVASRLSAWLAEVDPPRRVRRGLERQIRIACDALLLPGLSGAGELAVAPHPITLARNGLQFRPTLHLLAGATIGKLDEAHFVNGLFERLEGITDADRLFDALLTAAAQIRRTVEPMHPNA